MPDRLRLSTRHRRVLEALLREHLPDVEVWAYGSRVSGLGHDGSDLDLVLRGSGLDKIPFDRLLDFEEAVRNPRFRSSSRRGTGLGCRSGFTGRLSASMWWVVGAALGNFGTGDAESLVSSVSRDGS